MFSNAFFSARAPLMTQRQEAEAPHVCARATLTTKRHRKPLKGKSSRVGSVAGPGVRLAIFWRRCLPSQTTKKEQWPLPSTCDSIPDI